MAAYRRVNLGSGDNYREGWLNVDHRREGPGNRGGTVKVDVLADLNEPPWPFEDDAFEYALLDNVMEHLDDHLATIQELHRILEPGGVAEVAGPHWNAVSAWRDPTHTRPFDYRVFDHYLVDDLFEVESIDVWKPGKAKYIPDRFALWLADHIGHIVGGFRVKARVL
ncbi:methyltransferase domain-containing protein [Halobellus inordinatus]|uniref:methyltransferase domain-containing protein n=1 Tax=Halobellus inordinatus TaxID=1126236 RepID=UPI002113C41D|nr:methyltransferase domain-containing protein [Halobellus ramosii]